MTRRRVYLDELIDATEVAHILGLTHRTAVNTYLKRYPDMPRPVIVLPNAALWLRPEVERWNQHQRRDRRRKTSDQ